jgi:hypothetical protein
MLVAISGPKKSRFQETVLFGGEGVRGFHNPLENVTVHKVGSSVCNLATQADSVFYLKSGGFLKATWLNFARESKQRQHHRRKILKASVQVTVLFAGEGVRGFHNPLIKPHYA